MRRSRRRIFCGGSLAFAFGRFQIKVFQFVRERVDLFRQHLNFAARGRAAPGSGRPRPAGVAPGAGGGAGRRVHGGRLRRGQAAAARGVADAAASAQLKHIGARANELV